MNNQGLNELVAIGKQAENERKIAAAELLRQAKAMRRGGAPADAGESVVAARSSTPAYASAAGSWRWLGRGLAGVVVRLGLA